VNTILGKLKKKVEEDLREREELHTMMNYLDETMGDAELEEILNSAEE
jgi:hypothetical protein